jgi:hypothetical protein
MKKNALIKFNNSLNKGLTSETLLTDKSEMYMNQDALRRCHLLQSFREIRKECIQYNMNNKQMSEDEIFKIIS